MNITELDSYNLADAVKFNDHLNPAIWAGNKMKPEVRERLMTIAQDFKEFLGLSDLEVRDITVSGSNAGYTYTPHSDIDLHLVVDIPQADTSEVYRELFDAKKYQYNDLHNITIGGYDVELYVEDARKQPVSQGIYSVLNNDWVKIPLKRRATVDDEAVKSKFEDIGHRIEAAIESGNADAINELSSKIKNMRQAGLDEHGELGPENLAYKMLRSQGMIKKLYDARMAAQDRALSLKEKAQPQPVRYGFKAAAPEVVTPVAEGTALVKYQPTPEQTVVEFVAFCVEQLGIEQTPRIQFKRDPAWSERNKTFGSYNHDTNLLTVSLANRHVMDILRTVAHELTHQRQGEVADVPDHAGETGSRWENEANAQAGVLMREYGQQHPDLFAEEPVAEASGYIPTKKQARLPQFSNALSVDVRPGAVGKEANKMSLHTDSQGHPKLLIKGLKNALREYKETGRISKEDYSADNPPGPEFKPTMPKGTLRVDVSDVYDWYKLGNHISDLEGLGHHDFGQGPPSTIISFGDEDTEHEFIDNLKATGLDVTDIDPKDPKRRPGQKIKTDPTYNVDESEQLDEVKMSPSALKKFAASDAAKGIQAGFEAELIFYDTQREADEDDYEADYDADERAYSIQDVIDFFSNDDYGYGLSDRGQDRLRNELDERYYEWYDEQVQRDFENEADDLVREQWLEERPMVERIHDALTDGMGLTDQEADRIIAVGEKAPRFTKHADQVDYKEENPDYATYLEAADIADSVLDEDVEASVSNQDGYYDQALDNFRDNYQVDDSDFFTDVGWRWMSSIANDLNLDWPIMSGSSSGSGTISWEEIASSLEKVLGKRVVVGSGYHQARRKPNEYVLEPDGSLSPDNDEDTGLELVSPPMPLDEAIDQLNKLINWVDDSGAAYTNSSTGLHMGVSVPYKGGDVDYLKLMMFLGDQYVLEKFGRAANSYTESALKKIRQNVKSGSSTSRDKVASAMELMKNNLIELAQKYLQQGVGSSKYTSAHLKPGYIEFRSPGGDYLAKANEEIGALEDTMRRFAYAMYLAGRPDLERPEYYKKLYKLIAPEGDDALNLFSKFAAGEIDQAQLKKDWAEKTLAKEVEPEKAGQWVLYNRSTGERVGGQEYGNYKETDAVERAKAKLSPGSSMTDFLKAYKMVDMSVPQVWKIFNSETGEIYDLFKAANRGKAMDHLHDNFVNRPGYENLDLAIDLDSEPDDEIAPPKKLSRRAELAKQITQPGDYVIINKHSLLPFYTFRATSQSAAVSLARDYLESRKLDIGNFSVQSAVNAKRAIDNARDSRQLQQTVQGGGQYEIVDRRTSQVVSQYTAASAEDAGNKYNNWLRNQGMPVDTENYGYRPAQLDAGAEQRAQNIRDSAPRADFEIYDSSNNNNVVNIMRDATADRVREVIRSYETPSGGYAPGVLRVRQIDTQPQQATTVSGVPQWEVYEKDTGHVVHTFADHNAAEARRQGMSWLTGIGAEDPGLFDVRPKMAGSLRESVDTLAKSLKEQLAQWQAR